MKWFRHDSAAHRDAKLKRLKHKHGIIGYGLYWYCLELIAGNVEKNNISFELEDDAELIALEWDLDRVTVSEIMGDMVSFGLFENSDGRITCLKMAHRLDDTTSRNPHIRDLINSLNSSDNSEESSEIVGDCRNSSEIPDQIRLDKTRSDETSQKDPSQEKESPRSAEPVGDF